MQSNDENSVIINGDLFFTNEAFSNSDENLATQKNKNGWNPMNSEFGSLGTVLSSLENNVEEKKTENESLVYTTVQIVPKMPFHEEIRGNLDLKHYFHEITVLLDVQEESFHNIIYTLVEEMSSYEASNVLMEEVKSVVFADEKEILLSNTVRGVQNSTGTDSFDQSWICILGTVTSIKRRKIGLVRLRNPLNLGSNAERVKFIILILAPIKEKMTKNSYETARIFGTLFANDDFRQQMLEAIDNVQVKEIIGKEVTRLAKRPKITNSNTTSEPLCSLGTGLWENLKRRSRFYCSDFVDGVIGESTIHKTISTVFFLYFACILPCIAFGVLNAGHTENKIDAGRALIGQAIGGLAFALFGGQPLVIIATTALVSLYIEVVYKFSEQLEVDFYAMYACVGLWNSFFVLLYSVFGISNLIKWSTRSVEEIFAMFIFVCFVVDATKDVVKSFYVDYLSEECLSRDIHAINETINSSKLSGCFKENSLLFLILMLGTVWLSVTIYDFNKTPYLSTKKRELFSDYALPIGIVVFSFIGSFVFRDIKRFKFDANFDFARASVEYLNWDAILVGCGLGFALSLLFFMDQNISGQIVNSPSNKLKKLGISLLRYALVIYCLSLVVLMSNKFKSSRTFEFNSQLLQTQPLKWPNLVNFPFSCAFFTVFNVFIPQGSTPHLDLFVIAIINAFLSMYGLPWMHGILPQSPLHVRSLADVKEHLHEGCLREIIVKVRETRLTGILCHILIGLSLFLIPYPLAYIPVPVLDGLFLYCAVASLRGNSMFERFLLLFTEQSAYPPNHYIRRCPQRKIHVFTIMEVIQLLLICFVGFSPWTFVQMAFPLVIALLIPIRHLIVPLMISKKHLEALDFYY